MNKKTYLITLEINSELEIEQLKKSILNNKTEYDLVNLILLSEEGFYNDDNPQKCPPYQSTLRHHANILIKGDEDGGIDVYRVKH